MACNVEKFSVLLAFGIFVLSNAIYANSNEINENSVGDGGLFCLIFCILKTYSAVDTALHFKSTSRKWGNDVWFENERRKENKIKSSHIFFFASDVRYLLRVSMCWVNGKGSFTQKFLVFFNFSPSLNTAVVVKITIFFHFYNILLKKQTKWNRKW